MLELCRLVLAAAFWFDGGCGSSTGSTLDRAGGVELVEEPASSGNCCRRSAFSACSTLSKRSAFGASSYARASLGLFLF